jgi:hypothetical protein
MLLAGPYVAVGLYVWFIYTDYSTYLSGTLQYNPPAIGVAPEVVLGFGFWPTWFLFFVPVVLLSVLVYRYASKNIYYYLALLVLCAPKRGH